MTALSSPFEEAFVSARPIAKGLEEEMGKVFPILDHGFIRVVDYMGNDSAVVQAARVSYGKGTKKVQEDRGLIRYLMRHRHSTPFEMCEIKFHVKMPIFVARQWIRHRMASVNEYSARYSMLSKEFYLPTPNHIATQSSSNKQGRGDIVTPEVAEKVLSILEKDALQCHEDYEHLLDKNGLSVARELARINLTLNTYTEWYWKIDLHNLMHFLALRSNSHAQYEIRVYAEKMIELLEKWVPHTAEAFKEYRLGSYSFSATMLNILKRQLKGEEITQENSGLSKREWAEMQAVLDN